MVIKNLNYFKLPLQGVNLIEASAGTGKTYTLVILYLRLLLGLGGKSAYRRLLCVEEILVVTFTEAATKELHCRIRDNIHRLRIACICGKSDDLILSALLIQIKDLQLASLHLLAAERQIDEAAIYTIHGFCQRMLNHHAFESGMLFKQTLIEDESMIYQQMSADFWRRYCYPLPINIARIVHRYWQGPENLLKELLPYLRGEIPNIYNSSDISESITTKHENIITSIKKLKQHWYETSAKINKILNDYKINYKVYSHKNLSSWINKINYWSKESTLDYRIPNELMRFKSSVLKNNTTDKKLPQHKLFKIIEDFYHQNFSLREHIFNMALVKIRQAIDEEKKRRSEIGFDDLLKRLDYALSKNNSEVLANLIRTHYPVAMIDEFQDTNPQQYRIFHRIYNNKYNCCLLLIGDPKQSIYSFRGADVFTYMRARNEVDAKYTLNVNWRSSPGMINAVNKLFQNLPEPFIYKNIPFFPVSHTQSNTDLNLVIWNQPEPALRIWLQPVIGTSLSEYKQFMACKCAATIHKWLCAANKNEAWFKKGYKEIKILEASDITVIVRNRDEASLIRDRLTKLNIPTVYLSNKESVFETFEANELKWILKAVLMLEKDNALQRALSTRMLGFNAINIDNLNKNELCWEQRVEEFINYRKCWQKKGIQSMLHQIIINYHVAENLLASQGGERRLTNIFHLSELLQEASIKLENEFAIIRWLELQIKSPNPQLINQRLRIESDRHLVRITTVHKSKGLEFPIVFLPFIADFRIQKRPIFHDRQTYKTYLDLSADQKSLKLADEERLAEDLRLFYVAMTRSIYHCSIGIAPLYYNNRKKNGTTTDLHLSAPGYLIQKGKKGNIKNLRDWLKILVTNANGDISTCETSAEITQPLIIPYKIPQILNARNYSAPVHDLWRITSYSSLQKQSSSSMVIKDLYPQLNTDIFKKNGYQEKLQLTQHTFPRGKTSGIFLHKLLETINFNKLLDLSYINKKLLQHGGKYDDAWIPILTGWMKDIVTIPLDNKSLSLIKLNSDSFLSELPFCIPVNTLLQASNIDYICKKYDPLSARCSPISFQKFTGMLKGFIDLVFRWKDRYYILDYKSNWLGEDNNAYVLSEIEKVMIIHRYELQYQLYTLVLHRFLRHRLKYYSYQRDFGGIYYLFLRGVDIKQPGNGIFYYRPNIALVNELDNLFNDKTN